MNDLMTKSFLSYVDLKKQAMKDMEADLDIEKGGQLSPMDEQNLSQFFQEVAAIEIEIEEITNLLFDLQNLNEGTKSTHSAKVLRGLRDRMESDIVSVLRKTKCIKERLESLDRSNIRNRRKSESYKEGTCVDRTRVSITSGLRVKLREIMNEFQSLREKILSDYKGELKRRYYNATGEEPTEEVIEKIVSGGEKVQLCYGKAGDDQRHDAVMDVQRSLKRLHQVFLDMALLVETQGEKIDDIEENVANASDFISGGTDSLYYAKQMKKKTKTWVFWVWAVGCSNMEELQQIHGRMLKTGLVVDDIPVSKVLTFCVSPRSGNLQYAQMVFERIRRPNTFMYNIMMRGYSNSSKPEKAILLYQQMLHHSVPHNAYTFPFLLKACSCLSALEETKQIHAHIIKLGFGSDVYATNSLIHVYAVSGSLKSACLLFERLSERDTVSWNSMIDGYARCGQMEVAYEIFKDMQTRNIISWTTMISGYLRAGMHKEALNLFHEMQIAGVKPDKVALSSALSACAHLGALEQGRWIHTYVKRVKIEIDPILGCVLIDMYAKCGNLEEALEVFMKVKKKEVSVWTALISGYAIHGHGREALNWKEKLCSLVWKESINLARR
ncbi:hypothetical protein SLEP1_g12066 [Rubroshorea leprosula]|nr:hypothetical protein SLEP1_g12066 [Rubroshorea leprosula]